MDEIAQWVKQVRADLGLTQERFGELFSVTKGNVSAWENGRHSPSWAQIAKMSALSGRATPDGQSSEAPYLTPRQQALIGLFDGLTEGQQEELIRELEKKKLQNDELMQALKNRRSIGKAG